MNNNGRPMPAANIYKHGRLKTRKEMEEDGTLDRIAMDGVPDEIKNKTFSELLEESKPITQEKLAAIRVLVGDIDINLDEPLTDDD